MGAEADFLTLGMVLKLNMSSDAEIVQRLEIQNTLSTYACAAKTLFSANTNAKRLIGLKQNPCKTLGKPYILIDSRGRLTPIEGTKFEAKRPREDPDSHGYRAQKNLEKKILSHK